MSRTVTQKTPSPIQVAARPTPQLSRVDEAMMQRIEESDDFQRLVRALKRARDFALYFVRCNLPAHRLELMARVSDAVFRPVTEVKLSKDYAFMSTIAEAVRSAPPDALLFVLGLENLLPSMDKARRDQTLEILNWQRGAFKRLHRPIVFWMPEYLVSLLAEGAPDFWDWHSGLYEFETSPPARDALFQSLIERGDRADWNLNLSEKHERIVLLTSLLEEYRGTSAMGMIHKARGNYDAALQWYQKSVALQEALGDRAGLATSYNNIGEVCRARGDYAAALEWYEKSVATQEALGDYAGLATSFSNIGGVYFALGDFQLALNWLQQAIQIGEQLGDRAALAQRFENAGGNEGGNGARFYPRAFAPCFCASHSFNKRLTNSSTGLFSRRESSASWRAMGYSKATALGISSISISK
jgi:tetratricopeptide (TPR) repeat protein